MDLLKNYTSEEIKLPPDYEGKVKAVLTASNRNTGKRRSVLYLHGYVDYFFHPHLGDQFNRNDYDFYALDLRKHGRSLMPHQHPNYCKDLTEYFEEISLSIQKIKTDGHFLFLLAHSTGGLTASYYMNYGKERNSVDGLILNSPFFDFNQSKIEKQLSQFIAKVICNFSNYAKVEGALSPAYAQSIHKGQYGEWDFNLDWKPIKGFPTYFKWILAISRAQKKLTHSNIKVPTLIMHSSGSIKTNKFIKEAMSNDIVLNIEDIKRIGRQLGGKVTMLQIDKAQHDIFLSSRPVRDEAFDKMFTWLKSHFH